jgi:hypothetical protein
MAHALRSELLRLVAEWRRAAQYAEHDSAITFRRCADDLVAILAEKLASK